MAHADVDLAAFGSDHDSRTHRLRGIIDLRRLRRFLLGRLVLLAFVIIGNGIHQRGMGLVAILAVLLEAFVLLECKHSGFGFVAEFGVGSMLGQLIAQLHQKFLHGLDICADHTLLEQTGAERDVGIGRGRLIRAVVVIDERQLVPVRPATALNFCFDAAVGEALPFDGISAADVVADVAVLMQSHADDLRQGINGAPVHPLTLGIREHAVGGFVRTLVCTEFAGEGLVGANGFNDADAAASPSVALAAANAIGADLLLGDVILIAGRAAGAIVGRVLLGLAAAQGFGAFINNGAVPIRLAEHTQAECRKMLVGERCIDSLRHRNLQRKRAAA